MNTRDAFVLSGVCEVLRTFVLFGCPVCGGDCASANPPLTTCPMRDAAAVLARAERETATPNHKEP